MNNRRYPCSLHKLNYGKLEYNLCKMFNVNARLGSNAMPYLIDIFCIITSSLVGSSIYEICHSAYTSQL